MGICSSCLGLNRRSSGSDPSDTSHLLNDSYQPQYGSINTNAQQGPQPDPEEIRRQRDALERICAQTSDKLIDVSQSTATEEGSKMTSEYPRLFAERFAPSQHVLQNESEDRPDTAESTEQQDAAKWLADAIGDSDDEEGHWSKVQPLESGALTIQFDEVLSGNGKQPIQAGRS